MGHREEEAASHGRKDAAPPLEKNHKKIDFPATDTPELREMRARLIQDLKTPFIERVNAASSYSFIKEVKVENFDERVMTLPDKEIFDLYAEYTKIRGMKSEKKKEVAKNSLLERIETSILSDGSFLRRIFKRRLP